MRVITAHDAKNRFGQFLDAARNAPVRVTKNGRVVAVMMSVEHYERLRGTAWEQLTTTMNAMGAEASDRGLTDAKLQTLVADES